MGKKILVVDDEPQIVNLISLRLKESGYEILTAGDGQTALQKAREEKPDLIILDLMLPKMDGYKVCALLKADMRFNKIPIILLTARGQETDRVIGQEVGANAYITKPFQATILLNKLKGLLGEESSHG